jgi:uncharacterized membrane protein
MSLDTCLAIVFSITVWGGAYVIIQSILFGLVVLMTRKKNKSYNLKRVWISYGLSRMILHVAAVPISLLLLALIDKIKWLHSDNSSDTVSFIALILLLGDFFFTPVVCVKLSQEWNQSKRNRVLLIMLCVMLSFILPMIIGSATVEVLLSV